MTDEQLLASQDATRRERDLLDTARAIVLQSMAMGVTTSHESVRTAVRLARTMLEEIATPTPEPKPAPEDSFQPPDDGY